MPELGDSFRSARKARRLSIDDVAEETRISPRFLRAIEDEDFQQLPGGLFSRGFIRTYAGRLGLDADEAVARYAALTEDAEPGEPAVEEPDRPDRSERHIVPIAIGALVVLIAIFYFFFQDPASEMPMGNAGDVVAGDASSDPTPAPRPRSVPQRAQLDPGIDARAADSAEPERSGATVNGPDVDSEMMANVDSEAIADSAPGNLPERDDAAADDGVGTLSRTMTLTDLVVELDARDATWIRVRSDGAPAEELTMQPGMARTFSADQALDMRIGNAAGVTVRINGEAVRGLGNDGQVVSLNITPDNYRSLIDPD